MTGPPEQPKHQPRETLSAETIHELRTPLTVIKAQSQMVGRWLRRQELVDADGALHRLMVIEAMVGQLAVTLDGLREASPPRAEDGERDSN